MIMMKLKDGDYDSDDEGDAGSHLQMGQLDSEPGIPIFLKFGSSEQDLDNRYSSKKREKSLTILKSFFRPTLVIV